jgi:acetyltransferase (GNAT) family protein
MYFAGELPSARTGVQWVGNVTFENLGGSMVKEPHRLVRNTTLDWHAVNSCADPVVPQLLAIYEKSFPIEVLVSPEVIVALIEKGDRRDLGAAVFHIGAALEDDVVVGGAVFIFLRRCNIGFINYIFVESGRRGRGVGEFIYHHLRSILERDATALNDRQLEGVLFEVEREDSPTALGEPMEKIKRLRFFGRMGAGILEGLDYVQPPLHAGEDPLPMYLMFEPIGTRKKLPSLTRLVSWVENIYRVVYIGGSGLETKVVGESLHRITESLRVGSVTLRHPH